ncbi:MULTISPECIES: DNA alkylation repair protein [Myxococcus]|uniref:DNA alkylation repair protein n=1 Tax=Myxococcus TaxID=32 RepID=UPI00114276F9|nr:MULTISPECIES: DNA alkylation repair protein [Myxococcus]NOK02954.1 DNA alkylation repair protein [Myxococcus xanthus]
MSPPRPRKGATRAADIPPDVLDALSRGEMQTATLAECMAIDQARLLRAVFPELSADALATADAACKLGILKRMSTIGALLLEELGTAGIERSRTHGADMVRGWACFMIGAHPELDLPARLVAIRPLADDSHFGVREWSWMAVRPHLARELDVAIAVLATWTSSRAEFIRRFASEALRPRGVWSAHIPEFQREPGRALPILSPLRADPSTYVQDSVANWLNDAAKTQPSWVRDLCAQWQRGDPADATRRICKRASRNLR